MTGGDHLRARRRYRVLLRAYPRAYRERFGDDMEHAFFALLARDRARYGFLGACRCWIWAGADALRHGAVERWRGLRRNRSHATGGWDVLETLWWDIRYAVRSLVHRPVFAGTAVTTIALGIGANASVFTVVSGFMLAPLPYEDPGELVAIWSAHPGQGWSGTDINPADAMDWRDRVDALEDLAVFDDDGFNLTGGDAPELVSGVRTTPNLLALLGRAPALGRDFAPTEMGPGADRVVLLTDGFWERRFGRDPGVLGSTLTLDGEAVTVVGIMPPDFAFMEEQPDVLRPLDFDPATAPRGAHHAKALARMADGADIDQVRRDLVAVARQLESEHPENEGWTVSVTSLHADLTGETATQAAYVLMVAVGFVLLMACVNVANLLLARSGGRARELAVRVAMGAGRGRVAGQLVTESFVIAVAGGALGLAFAFWGYRAIVAALPSTIPPVFRFGMDTSVLAFTATITVGAVLVFGVLPALRASASDPGALRDGGRAGPGRRGGRFGSALVVLQTVMATVLLVGGGLLMKSVAGMRTQDFGFDSENVITARVALPESEYDSRELSDGYWRAAEERLRELPGVVAVGTTQSHPLMGSNWNTTVRIAGHEGGENADRSVRVTYASVGLFDALGFDVVRGRTFDERDAGDAPARAIVNETFVRRYLSADEDPLTTVLENGDETVAVVGVVADVLERGVDRRPEPSLYRPMERADIRTRSIVVKTAGDPLGMLGAIQRAVWAVDGDIPLYNVETMEALVERRVGGFAVIGYLMAVFAVLSLVLGAVGIYGVTAYSAAQRTNEIGVRLAMGAERRDVVRMVVGQGAVRALLGLSVGLGLALLMGSALSGILVGVSPRDPATFVAVTGGLVLVSFLGLYVPARRASSVDPVRALAAD